MILQSVLGSFALVISLCDQPEHSFQLGDHTKALSLQSCLNYTSSCYINSGQSFLHLELIYHLVAFPFITSLLQNLPLFSSNDHIYTRFYFKRVLSSKSAGSVRLIEIMDIFPFEIHTSHSYCLFLKKICISIQISKSRLMYFFTFLCHWSQLRG